jgi:hypothetical protein
VRPAVATVARMDRIEFRRVLVDEWGPPVATLAPYLNGRSLIDLAREVEMPFAEAEGHADIAGSYLGLDGVGWPSRHFLGRPEFTMRDGGTVLLGCTCGIWGCWPLIADVEVGDDTVVWSGFEQPYRDDWDHSALGSFRFDRYGYETALRATAS